MALSYPSRRSHRLKRYDYSQPGMYFVTLCVDGRRCLFGTVEDGEMHLNRLGSMVDEVWRDIPRFRRGIELDVHIVLPNHLHGIVVIPGDEGGRTRTSAPTAAEVGSESGDGVEGRHVSLPEVIQRFKTWTTKQYQASLPKPVGVSEKRVLWQRDYFDHTIRDEAELGKTRIYIVHNAQKWHLDHENPEVR